MLLSLNEHCLIRVCEFLSVEDQIQLSRTCELFQDFFENNFWNWKCKQICLTNTFWDEAENVAYLPKFLQVASASVEELKLKAKHIKYYANILTSEKLPKVKSCTVELVNRKYGVQVKQIYEMFPKIKELHVKGMMNEGDFSTLKEVEHLHLDISWSILAQEQYMQIYNLPKLKKITFTEHNQREHADIIEALYLASEFSATLEEISINEYMFSYSIMNVLSHIKNLRTIHVRTRGIFAQISFNLSKLEMYFGEAIDTLIFNKIEIFQDGIGDLMKLKYLRRMVFYKSYITKDNFEQLCRNMPSNLEEFYYVECWTENDEEEMACKFFPLLVQCQRLKLLDVSSCELSKNFAADIVEIIKLQERKQPLLLRCFQTEITQEILQNLALPENIRVSMTKEKFDFDKPDKKYYQVNFDHKKMKKENERINLGEIEELYKEDYNDEYVWSDSNLEFCREEDFANYSDPDLARKDDSDDDDEDFDESYNSDEIEYSEDNYESDNMDYIEDADSSSSEDEIFE